MLSFRRLILSYALILTTDMRAIFSNKKPGCEATPSQYGVSLFVNSWQQGDGRLHVEVSNTHMTSILVRVFQF